jgi:hypothetical protein
VNIRLPSIWLPCAIRLLMYLGYQRAGLYRANRCALQHFGRHVFYHGSRGYVDQTFHASVLLEDQRLRTARKAHVPGLASQLPHQADLQFAFEFGRVFAGLQHQHLPANLT